MPFLFLILVNIREALRLKAADYSFYCGLKEWLLPKKCRSFIIQNRYPGFRCDPALSIIITFYDTNHLPGFFYCSTACYKNTVKTPPCISKILFWFVYPLKQLNSAQTLLKNWRHIQKEIILCMYASPGVRLIELNTGGSLMRCCGAVAQFFIRFYCEIGLGNNLKMANWNNSNLRRYQPGGTCNDNRN